MSEAQEKALQFVIIGGVAAGASCAARARRLSEDAKIIVLERGEDISFANCGMPYYIGGEIQDRSKLSLHTPKTLSELLNLDIRTRTEATKIDRERKVVIAYDHREKKEEEIPYDKLLLAPGANPIRPPLSGIEDERILSLRTLKDMDKIKEKTDFAKKVMVIGAGYIGLEMVEMFVKLGKEVTLVELQSQILPIMDSEMVKQAEVELVGKGVRLILGDKVEKFVPQEKALTVTLGSGEEMECDIAILCIGVQCESKLAKEADLKLGVRNSIYVNEFQQTSDPNIYAAGDAVETYDYILGKRVSIPLAGPANRQGRVAADHIFLGEKATPYPGTIGTAITRVFDVVVATTGYTEKRLVAENIPHQYTVVSYFQHAGYYPGAVPITLKVTWALEDGTILGAQAIGCDGVDKRIDILATAIAGKMNVEELCHLELSYAPPFGSARDVVNIAGFSAHNIRKGLMDPTYKLPESKDVQLLDVRPEVMAKANPLPDSIYIPLEELRGRLDELDSEKEVLTVCALGKLSYFAYRILEQKKFKVTSFVGGWNLVSQKAKSCQDTADCSEKIYGGNPVKKKTNIEPLQIDACGLSCPGPLMKLKEAADQLLVGQELIVQASDPGFAKDFAAYCDNTGLEFLGIEKQKGIITARGRKKEFMPQTVSATPKNGATIVVFSCDLDKVLASLVIANGAAAMGGKVTLFFTFWGLNALRKEGNVSVKGKTFMDKMFGWMMPKGIDALPLSRMHMSGMGTKMMKSRMKAKDLPNAHGLLKDAIKAGVRMVACSMSMEAMGIKEEELLDGVEIGGVADFLTASSKTATNLFI